MSFSWKCPFCNQNTTVIDEKFVEFDMGNKYGRQNVQITVIVCPNEECGEYSVHATLHDQEILDHPRFGRIWANNAAKAKWQLVPRSPAKVFPDYVPAPIMADYEEACLICDLSPKASATLARRCLQGMIRDFWGIKKKRLFDEIAALEQKVDSLTWKAIDSVRGIGNIGAHMEKDINLIVEVDPDEAKLLLQLIEMLVEEWYIARHEKQKKLHKIISVAGEKDRQRTPEPEGAQPQIIDGDNV